MEVDFEEEIIQYSDKMFSFTRSVYNLLSQEHFLTACLPKYVSVHKRTISTISEVYVGLNASCIFDTRFLFQKTVMEKMKDIISVENSINFNFCF